MVPALPPRQSFKGFTLLEVMVALVLTGLVVMVAYAVAQAGMDVRTRITSRLNDVEGARAAREILRDALRNLRAASDSAGARGGIVLANNSMSFVAAGGAAPLDPDYDWRFTLTSEKGRLRVTAVALGHALPAQVTFSVPDVTRWAVWMLAPDGSTWQSEWGDPRVMPRAIVMGFWNGRREAAPPLHLALWPGSAPPLPPGLADSTTSIGPIDGAGGSP